MTGQSEKFKIGLFVVASLLLAVGIVIWLGASHYFGEAQRTAVAYFTESVQGLESDSVVKFRGVPVGRVSAIRMAPDGRLIEVVLSLNRSFKITPDLGIKMNLLGLTGQKYLEIEPFSPDQAQEQMTLAFEPRYPVIPTYPSNIREFGNALENLFQKVKNVDLETTFYHLQRAATRLDTILSEPKLDKLGSDAAGTMREVKEAAKRLNEEIARAQIAKNFAKTSTKAGEFFDESTESARSINRMIRRTDNNLNRISQKFDRVADNLLDFTRMIRQKPSSIIFGGEEKSAPKR
ncbi:MAG: MCE family protein [Desulfomonile tiedjei]|nr:MCE family protein [Desulfomonile tiedjei]